jgi:hypothetical protein
MSSVTISEEKGLRGSGASAGKWEKGGVRRRRGKTNGVDRGGGGAKNKRHRTNQRDEMGEGRAERRRGKDGQRWSKMVQDASRWQRWHKDGKKDGTEERERLEKLEVLKRCWGWMTKLRWQEERAEREQTIARLRVGSSSDTPSAIMV